MDLWTAFARGDQNALGILFSRYYAPMFQYGRKLTAAPDLLEDAIQELFLDLWQKKTPPPRHSVKAYLFQALRFTLFKGVRNTLRHDDLTGEETDLFDLSAESLRIQEEENTERLAKILAALNQLPPRQKEIIYLKLYKGLSYEEISTVMQLNYQVVRNLLYTALKSFKKVCTC